MSGYRRAAAALLVWLVHAPAPAVAAAETIGPEVAVADPVLVHARYDQQDAQVAAGDGGFLAVWDDGRDSVLGTIYATRLDRDGNVLDPFGIRISGTAIESEWTPRVAWTGDDYLVVWDDADGGIALARVSPEGEVVDSSRRDLAVPEGHGFAPDVASTGDGSLVVWSDCKISAGECDADLYAAVVAPNGELRGPFPLVVAPGRQDVPAVAADPDGYVVTWETNGGGAPGIHALRVDETGAPLGAPVIVAPGTNRAPAVAFGGEHFLVVWERLGNADLDVLGTRLSRSATPLDPVPKEMATGPAVEGWPDVAPDRGGGWFVVWEDRRQGVEIFGTHVTPLGEPETAGGRRISADGGADHLPDVAFDGDTRMVVWTSVSELGVGSTEDVYGVPVPSSAASPQRGPRALTHMRSAQLDASIAWNGEVFLVVWLDGREDHFANEVFGARFTATGDPLDGGGFRVSPASASASAPVVASDGKGFLVAWEEWNHGSRRLTDVFGARVSAAGEVVERDIRISTARDYQLDVQVAWTGKSYLAVWEDHRRGEIGGILENADVYATSVTRSGTVSSRRGNPVVSGSLDHAEPDVAPASGGALVSWTEGCNDPRDEACDRDVFARRVGSSGRPAGVRLHVGAGRTWEARAAATKAGRGFLLAWTRGKGRNASIVGRRLNPGGRLTRTRVFVRGGSDLEPRLAWDGRGGLLAWDALVEAEGSGPRFRTDAFATRISARGRVAGAAFALASNPQWEFVSDVAEGREGCAAVAYWRDYGGVEGTLERAFFRTVGTCAG